MSNKIYALNHHWNMALSLALSGGGDAAPRHQGDDESQRHENRVTTDEDKIVALTDAIFIDPRNTLFYSKRADMYL